MMKQSIILYRREVSKDEAEQFANSNSLMFIETSAKTGVNIDELFIKSGSKILERIENKELNPMDEVIF